MYFVYENCCNTAMSLFCGILLREFVDDPGFPGTRGGPARLRGTRAWPLEAFETVSRACGPCFLDGSVTAGIRAGLQYKDYYGVLFKNFKMFWIM